MKNDKSKWGTKNTELLIREKHSEEFVEKFRKAIGNPKKQSVCWNELGAIFDPSCGGKEAKGKYNQLLSTYRTKLATAKKSGAAAGKQWKYMQLFHATFPYKAEEMMTDVEDLGICHTDQSDIIELKEEKDEESDNESDFSVTSDNESILTHRSSKVKASKTSQPDTASLKKLKRMALEVYINKNRDKNEKYVTKKEFEDVVDELKKKSDETNELLKRLLDK